MSRNSIEQISTLRALPVPALTRLDSLFWVREFSMYRAQYLGMYETGIGIVVPTQRCGHVSQWERESEREREKRERESVRERERARERKCVCVRESERERRERERVCVCVRERERESKRECV